MLRRFGVNFVIFAVVMDAAVVWLGLSLAEQWRPDLVWLPFSRQVAPEEHVPELLHLAVPVLWIVVFFLYSLYDPRAIFRVGEEFRILVLGSGFAGLASAGLIYLAYRDISRWLFLVFVAAAFVLLLAWRLAARLVTSAVGHPGFRQRRVLVVGVGESAQDLGRLVEAHRWAGLTLVGYLSDSSDSEACGGPVLGTVGDVREVVQARQVDDVVVALPYGDRRLHDVVGELLDLPVHVRVIPAGFALALDRPAVEDFAGVPLIDLRAGPLSEYQRVVKRLLDLSLGAVLTVIALPIMAVAAVAIKLDSPGPVLFKQPRVGENGKLFTILKFRTMVDGAEQLQDQVTTRDAEGHVVHKRVDDPRITRVGRFLRRTSLDELPQFFNVLRGDMSLVGPRPELPWLVAQYEPWQRRRLVVPQGLTGWWQVNGRSNRLMHLHTHEDIEYITNYSFWLDLRILWKTLWVVLQRKGAY